MRGLCVLVVAVVATLTSTASLANAETCGNGIDDDADGYADVVFANHIDDLRLRDIDSVIYFGGPDGFDPLRRQGLPTTGAHGCAVGDLDNDGYLDLVFANILAGASYVQNSFVYWGSSEGYSAGEVDGDGNVPSFGVPGALTRRRAAPPSTRR